MLRFAPLVLAFAFLAGCREERAPATTTTTTAAPRAEPSLSPTMRLALQKLTDASAATRVIDTAQREAEANPLKDETWIVLGRAWVRKARESNDPGFYLNADACAAIVLERHPDHALALDLRGLVLLNGHKFADAHALATKILAQRPDDPMAWGTASDALLEMGRYDDAIHAAQTMVDLKPNLPSYSRASHLQWLRGDTKNAKATVRAALDAGRAAKRDPEPGAWVLVQAAMIFWNEGDVDGAEAGFDKALERVAEYPPALVGKGRVAMARGRHAQAAELLGRAYAGAPLVETAWLLGDARAEAGDAKGADEAYALVVRDGHRVDPRTLSLFLSTKNKEPAEALRLAREEYASRQDIYTEDALAWALYRSGDLVGAKASITRARRLGTPDPRLLYHEGVIRSAAGDTKAGRALVAKAMALNPAFDATASKEARSFLDGRS